MFYLSVHPYFWYQGGTSAIVKGLLSLHCIPMLFWISAGQSPDGYSATCCCRMSIGGFLLALAIFLGCQLSTAHNLSPSTGDALSDNIVL